MKSSVATVAKRYAKALFDLSTEQGNLDLVRGDLDHLAGLATDSTDFEAFLENPRIPVTEKDQIFRRLFKDPESPTLRFVRFLNAKYRSNILPDICGAFAEMHDEQKGILKVHVTSAHDLSQAQTGALTGKLADRTGKTISLTTDVDPDLIGGFRMKIGDEITDLSIANKLAKFRLNVINS